MTVLLTLQFFSSWKNPSHPRFEFLKEMESNPGEEVKISWLYQPKTAQNNPKQPKTAQNSPNIPNLRFWYIKRDTPPRILLERLWMPHIHKSEVAEVRSSFCTLYSISLVRIMFYIKKNISTYMNYQPTYFRCDLFHKE